MDQNISSELCFKMQFNPPFRIRDNVSQSNKIIDKMTALCSLILSILETCTRQLTVLDLKNYEQFPKSLFLVISTRI
jgi:hypothetical protein